MGGIHKPIRAISPEQRYAENQFSKKTSVNPAVKRSYRKRVRQFEWTSGLPTRCANALRAYGFTSRKEMECIDEQTLMRIPQIGIKSVADICDWLGRSPAGIPLPDKESFSFASVSVEKTAGENLEALK